LLLNSRTKKENTTNLVAGPASWWHWWILANAIGANTFHFFSAATTLP